MFKEQLISLETAKLAKLKGFDKDTNYIWLENAEYGYNNFVGDLAIEWTEEQNYRNYDNKYSASTLSLLQKYLREIHKTYVSPRESWSFENTLEFVCTVNSTYVNHGIKDKPINRFDSYEEALEEGLKYALNQLKDV